MLLVADIVGPTGRRSVRLRGYLADGTSFYDERERTRGGRHAARILSNMVEDLLDGGGLDAFEEEEEEDDEEEDDRDRRRSDDRDRDRDRGDRDRDRDRDDEEEEGWDDERTEVEEDRPVRTFGNDEGEDGDGDVASRARVGDVDAARGTFLWINAGINITARSMEMPLAGGEARQYQGGAYPGFEVAGAFYPAAPWVDTWPGNLGIYARYGRHIAVSSYYNGEALETTQHQVDVMAQYRWSVQGRRSGIALIPSLGYMRLGFQVPDNGPVDDFVYQAMAVGLELYAPLPWAGLALRAGGRYGMVLNMGDVGRAYAQAATVHGYEARLELSGRIIAGFRYVVAFEVFGFESEFVGHGDVAQAESAHDIYFRGTAGLAYNFEAGGG